MSGDHSAEVHEGLQALRLTVIEAQQAMEAAGFNVADHHTPLDMVTNLLARNQDQRKIEDGLRERLKAAAEVCATWKQRAEAAEGWIIRKGWITGDTYEVNTEGGTDCPFHIAVGGCNAWRSKENGDWCRCANDGSMAGCPPGLRTPCRLDEGPILVKKATEDSGSAADGAGRPPPQQPVAGGDRLNDPERPR